jgi:hypothetical protein
LYRVRTRLAASRPTLPATEPRTISRSINDAVRQTDGRRSHAVPYNKLRARQQIIIVILVLLQSSLWLSEC